MLPFHLVSLSVCFDFIFVCMDIIDNMHNVRAEVIHIFDSFSAVACDL